MQSSSRINWGWSKIDVFKLILVISARSASKHCSVKSFIFSHACTDFIELVFNWQPVFILLLMPWKLEMFRPYLKILEFLKIGSFERNKSRKRVPKMGRAVFPSWMLSTSGQTRKRKRHLTWISKNNRDNYETKSVISTKFSLLNAYTVDLELWTR